MSKTRSDIIKNAEKYLGKPYVWGGESMQEGGYDCSGYVYNVLKDSGFKVSRSTAQGYYNSLGTVVSEPQEGDLIFFGKSTKQITHIAVYAGGGKMYESIGSSQNNKKNPGKGVTLSDVTRRKDRIAYKRICTDSAQVKQSDSAQVKQSDTAQQATYKVGDTVTYSTCYDSSSDPVSKAHPCDPWRSGRITQIESGARNPYLIENGRCWLNDGDIRSKGSVQQTSPASAVYTVKKGDTMTKIARANGTTVDVLKKLNGIRDVNKISIGQKIKIK